MFSGKNDQTADQTKTEKEFMELLGKFMSDILCELPSGWPPTRLIVVPHMCLNKVPFGAVPVHIDLYGGERKYLGDVFEGGIWLNPSLSIAMRIDERRAERKKLSECHILSTTCPSLPLRDKHDMMIRRLGDRAERHVQVRDPYSPRSAIRKRSDLGSCDVFHVTCHSCFADGRHAVEVQWNPCEVLNSSGLLFGRERAASRVNLAPRLKVEINRDPLLNMVDIWEMRLKKCTLASVVSCSGAVVDVSCADDESLSIGTAILVAGASMVVCSMWPVHKLAAVAIISRLYETVGDAICDGDTGADNVCSCLWKAGQWFRELSSEEYFQEVSERFDRDGVVPELDPARMEHWAAFVVLGPPP